MKKFYQISFIACMLLLVGIIVSSCGQNPTIKTITIVNGDTTISEGEFNEKEFAEMGKHIEISMTEDSDGSEKRIKKILIHDENEENKAFPRAQIHDAANVGVNVSEKAQEFENSEVNWQRERPDVESPVFQTERDFKRDANACGKQ